MPTFPFEHVLVSDSVGYCEVNAGIVDFKSGKILGINSRLAGITSGIIVMYGFLTNQKFDRWTAVFLFPTALTSLTGFLFPLTAMTPAIKLGIISLAVLALAIVTRYFMHLTWRTTYVIAACLVLYFNVFVLVVQSFEKIPSLKTIAPTQKEPPFAIAQIAVLLLFVVLTTFAVKRFRTAT